MPEKRIPERPALPRALVAFLVLVILFTGLSVASMLRQRLLTGHFRAFEALAPPLPGVDFYVYQDRMSLIHHEAFFTQPGLPWMYPAPAAPLYALLYRFCYHGAWIPGWCVLAGLTLTGCVFGVYRLSRAVRTKGAGVFFALSLALAWPVYLSLQRGNIESLLWLMLAAGIWAFAKERWWVAAALIGFAGAFKFYPLLCLGLFLPQKRWKEIALGVGVMSAVSVASLWFVNPDLGLAARQISAGVRLFTETYAGGVGRSQGIYDHSAFELLKVMVRPPSAGMQHLLHLYLVSAGAGMLGLFLLRMLRMPLLNQVLFLVAASVFLSPASFDYTLQSLYIPWAWIALRLCLREPAQRLWPFVVMALFAVELAPMTFVQQASVPLNGLVKGAGLLCLLVFAACVPMQWEVAEEVSERLAA